MQQIDSATLARIWGTYWGCQTTYVDDEGEPCKVNALTIDFMVNEKERNGQLALRPISSITDEDAIEVAKILRSHIGYHTAYHGHRLVSIIDDMRSDDSEEFTRSNLRACWDYLRFKSYDCGYGDIPSLIEAGIAIDLTTLNK